MKKMIINTLFFLMAINLHPLTAKETDIDQISFKAEGLWEARDYEGAKVLFESLQKAPLPDWQKKRLLYNRGTIALAQNQTSDALKLLQRIAPEDLSLPRFGRNLLLNEGIGYLQYAQNLALNPSSPYYSQQILFTEQGLRALDQALLIDCRLQQSEQENQGFACSPQQLIERWTKAALLQLDAIHRQKVQVWMKQASKESLASFLSILLQDLIFKAAALQKQTGSSPKESVLFLQHQAESLDPLWDSLKQKKLTPNDLAAFNQAAADYQNALKHDDLKTISDGLKSSFGRLQTMGYKEHVDLRLAHLNYEILLIQPILARADIQVVQWEVDQLKGGKDQIQPLEQIKLNLKNGLEAFTENHLNDARFYLLAGFGLLDSQNFDTNESAAATLQQALDQAKRALEMFLLSLLQLNNAPQVKQFAELLKRQQAIVLAQADLFIPQVLKEQAVLFHASDDDGASCQQSPWDQVIPLFDHGYSAAQNAGKLFNSPASDREAIAANLEQTVHDWQQAHAILLNPPKQNQPGQGGGGSSASNPNPRNLAETFRLIQEMYLEDQAQPVQENTERHSW